MPRRVLLTAAALLLTVGCAQSQEAPHKRHPEKPAPAKAAAASRDDAPLPDKMQKWFGDKVDDILTGADKALGPDGAK